MATYKGPKRRSLAELSASPHSPAIGSVLDISKYVNTAVPAGSRGRVVAVAGHLEEANNPGVPVRFIGDSAIIIPYNGIDKSHVQNIIDKWKAKGLNYLRIHGPENFLMYKGASYTFGDVPPPGTRQYPAQRWDELDYFLNQLRINGIYWGFGVMSRNLAVAIPSNTNDRWTTIDNTSGTATATISSGAVTGITVNTAGSAYTFPPTVIISGGNGTGAVATATINGSGAITGVTIVSGGNGYTVAPTIKFYGGSGNFGKRIFVDPLVKNEYAQLVTDFLTHVNAYSGVAYKDDPSLVIAEGKNESNITGTTFDAAGQELMTPLFQKWLSDRYGTIEALNAKWGMPSGAGFTSFTDTTTAIPTDSTIIGLIPRAYPDTRTNDPRSWLISETYNWQSNLDISMYQWYIDIARAAGYTGLVSGQDQSFGPYAGRVFQQPGIDCISIHGYGGLQDSYVSNSSYRSAGGLGNLPWSYSFTGIGNILTHMSEDKPKFWTEMGFSLPAKYRGEQGILYGVMSSMYDFSGITFHGDDPSSTKFGTDLPRTYVVGAKPLAFEHDPLVIASYWLTSILFHRRDADVVPVDKYVNCNDKALGYIMGVADQTQANLNTLDSRNFYITNEMPYAVMTNRVVYKWDFTNDATIASNWKPLIAQSLASWLPALNVPTTNETYDWVVTKGNNTGVNSGSNQTYPLNQSYKQISYTKNRQFFSDMVSGIMGVNTNKTQAGCVSYKAVRGGGSIIKQGKKYVANPDLNLFPCPAPEYKLNYLGNRFWKNLEINYADDTVLLGITSANNKPISEEDRIIVCCSANVYNNQAKWKTNGATIVSIPILNQGSGYVNKHIELTTTSAGSGSGFKALGRVQNGKVVEITVTDGGTQYDDIAPAQFTASIAGSTMTVSDISYGTIRVGQFVRGSGISLDPPQKVTGFGTGTGGKGTYTVSTSQTLTSRALTSQQHCQFVGSISGQMLTVTEVISGTLNIGQTFRGDQFSTMPTIIALGTGTGGVGTYALDISQTATSGRCTTGVFVILAGFGSDYNNKSCVLGVPYLAEDDPDKEVLLDVPFVGTQSGWPIENQRFVADFNIIDIDNSTPWILYELNFDGSRVKAYPTTKISNGINVRIDSSQLVKPNVFFELVKETQILRETRTVSNRN